MSSSLAVLLEVKTTHSSAVLSLHLSQCFTPPLKSIPASFFPVECANRGDPKMRVYLGRKLLGNREIAGEWECGSRGHGDKGHKLSWNQIQTLKECFQCHIHCAQLGVPWGKTVGASCAVSGNLRATRLGTGTLSFFLSLFLKTPPNHWTKQMVNTRLTA